MTPQMLRKLRNITSNLWSQILMDIFKLENLPKAVKKPHIIEPGTDLTPPPLFSFFCLRVYSRVKNITPFITSFRCLGPIRNNKCSQSLLYLIFPMERRSSLSIRTTWLIRSCRFFLICFIVYASVQQDGNGEVLLELSASIVAFTPPPRRSPCFHGSILKIFLW